MEFYQVEPTLENYWRGIILFGKNVKSYKFSLAKSLIELSNSSNDLVSLNDLAVPFSNNLCAHLLLNDKQGTGADGKCITACKDFNSGAIQQSDLITITAREGFNEVIDRFHNVNGGEIAERFFIKEQGGIRVTENLFKLFADTESHNLLYETEARWRLVETAWDLNLSRNLITIQTDNDGIELFTNNNGRRVDVTSSRGALNGYQKGKCFYCYDRISIISGDDTLADVDHFLPHTLIKTGDNYNVNGVWNLVLACQDCNRGSDGKFAKVPTSKLLKRLHKRNEYLITSHHPLRETLISQTGKTENHRKQYIQGCYDNAIRHLIHTWEPTPKDSETF